MGGTEFSSLRGASDIWDVEGSTCGGGEEVIGAETGDATSTGRLSILLEIIGSWSISSLAAVAGFLQRICQLITLF